jgi:hypothetical protein
MAPTAIRLADWAAVSEAEAKEWASINQENVPSGDILRVMLNTATRTIEQELHCEVISRGQIVEQHTIQRSNIWQIWLLERPVLEISEVNEDTTRDFSGTTEIPPTDYILDSDRGLIKYTGNGGSWPLHFTMGIDVLQVKYWAGVKTRDDVDYNLRGLVMETVAHYYYHLTRKDFAVRQITDDQGNRTFTGFNFLPKEVKAALADHPLRKLQYGRITGRRVSVDPLTPAP